MTVDEILQKIHGLSAQERDLLLRELNTLPGKPEAECATPETVASLHREQQSSHEERGLPIEDVLEDPTQKN